MPFPLTRCSLLDAFSGQKGKTSRHKKWLGMVAKRLRLLPFGKDGTRTTKWSDIKLQIFFELPLLICASLLKKEGSNFRGTNRLWSVGFSNAWSKTTIFHKNTKKIPSFFWGRKKNNEKSPALDRSLFLFGKNTRQLRKFPPCIERCGPARCEGFPPAALRAAASNPPRPKQNCFQESERLNDYCGA